MDLETRKVRFPVGSRCLYVGIDEGDRIVVTVRAHFVKATRVRFPDGAIHPIHPADLRPMLWRAGR